MNLKKMRRICADVVRDIDIPTPAGPSDLIAFLCRRMEHRLGRPVFHRLVRFPPGTVSGLWLSTDDGNYLLCEEATSPWHQLAITGHEFWHMEAGHCAEPLTDEDASRLIFPSLDPTTVARIVAARSYRSHAAEQEAEVFASLLLAELGPLMPSQEWSVPSHATELVDRLEATLGHGTDRRRRG